MEAAPRDAARRGGGPGDRGEGGEGGRDETKRRIRKRQTETAGGGGGGGGGGEGERDGERHLGIPPRREEDRSTDVSHERL